MSVNISEVWMRFEALAHLRSLPNQYKNLKAKIEAELAEIDDGLAPKPVPAPEAPKPRAIPASALEQRKV